MLPHSFPLEALDDGIRSVVVNINRIPGVFTNTTCEGHIWRDCPTWPTKDGWIHFNVRDGTNSELVPKIKRDFLEQNNIFELEEWGNKLERDYSAYTMVAHYESHDNGSLFGRINEQEQQEYFRRAEKRRGEILKGWGNFNEVLISYLKEKFGENYEILPF